MIKDILIAIAISIGVCLLFAIGILMGYAAHEFLHLMRDFK